MTPEFARYDRGLWRHLRALLLGLALVGLVVAPVGLHSAAAQAGSAAQLVDVVRTANGDIRLSAAAPGVPVANSRYERYGFFISEPQMLATPATRVRVAYDTTTPIGSQVMLDVRVSTDGTRWTAWNTDVASGAVVDFSQVARVVQYRARLFGGLHNSPVVQGVVLAAVPGTTQQVAPQNQPVAPTFRIRGTRLGLVGWRTANGHIIQPRDHFVSLPSWRSLSSRGGHEYQVRITYNGRSVVAPVWDVGPWNTRDDYWSVNRELYKGLPQGWPQDHAAYYDGHNGGYAEKGYVRFPTAIDIADGIWWDHLGIHGDQAELEVTFLWMGQDPEAVPAPSSDADASEYMVDELGPAFHTGETDPHSWDESVCGAGDHAYWGVTETAATAEAEQHQQEAFWHPELPVGGLYDIYAHVPDCPNDYLDTTEARYLVAYDGEAEEVVVDQAAHAGEWVHLGRFPFAAGDTGFVHLSNVAGDAERAIWFDNMKWVPVRDAQE